MRSGTLALAVIVAFAAATPVRAEDAQQAPQPSPSPTAQGSIEGCDVPDNLLATDSVLQKVTDTVKAGKPLDILVIGSRSSTIPQSEASAYPARLQVALKEALPNVTVNLSVEIQAKTTAEDAVGTFAKLLEAKKATLVVWQTGTVDAMRAVDPDDFHTAIDEGVVALQNAGADVILINPQYSPRTETMISLPPYIDNIRAVAQAHDIPLFDRFAIMHQWNDDGQFDLFSTSHGLELAKRVHDCLGRALSKFVIDAAHIGPSQQN
jgi:GDSL-like lipase/acylhydrolase family protein